MKKKLPIGVENFKELRKADYYYIDKTGFIGELIRDHSKINLFTRPRRFGKSLNMSMLESFFSMDSYPMLFEGLDISKETELCREHMGQYPVISVSLKDINAPSYKIAYDMAVLMINDVAAKAQYLLESDNLSEFDKNAYRKLLDDSMSEAVFCGSLKKLSELLEKHYGQPVILLIDEYDVPLAKAFANGYYDQMLFLIRGLFEQVLKTNNSLHFAVLTGCMRISKESIFTGLNNLKVLSVTDERFDSWFGFTDAEVRQLLEYYGVADHFSEIKAWYDGYQFGNTEIYCPWDVLNHCDRIRKDSSVQPENYWINTSSNDAVKKIIQESKSGVIKREIECLVAGEVIEKEIYQELTYQDMYASADHIWSLLFTTGYLTQRGKRSGRVYSLAIPNREIQDIFETQIMDCFRENVQKDGDMLNHFCDALQAGNAAEVERIFGEYLRKTISIRDTFVRKDMKENFYHGILLGILGVKEYWGVSSNREAGEGYSDILVEPEGGSMGIILEVKYAQDGDLEAACQKALDQVQEKHYEEELWEEGIDQVLKYGIACYKKRCRVMLADMKL